MNSLYHRLDGIKNTMDDLSQGVSGCEENVSGISLSIDLIKLY